MNKLKYLMCLVSCLVVAGCTLMPAKTSNLADVEALIAQDMVNVLVQIKELPAATTTLNIPSLQSAKDRFSARLGEKFRDAGYAVRTAGIAPGEAIVTYVLAQDMDPERGLVSTYTVTVGAISVRRAYVTTGNRYVKPLAPMQIKGASAAGLHLDNQLFEAQGSKDAPRNDQMAEREATGPESSLQPPAQPASTANVLPAASNTDQSLLAPGAAQESASSPEPGNETSLLNIVAPTTYSAMGQGSEPSALRELSNSPTRNVRDLGQSNFAEAFASLAIVKEIILTFDNDSVRMGQVNKVRVAQLVELFDSTTDVFSVIGCSNGATSLAMGQQGLALGRAERVREELLFAGVPKENILEEGCWAGEAYDERMPRRGVVLSLKRHRA